MENYLPKNVLTVVNLDSLEICKDSFIESDLKNYYSDMLYHDPQKWKAKNDFSSLLEGPVDVMADYIPDFQYVLYDLSRYADAEIKGTITARVVMLVFKHIFDQDFTYKMPGILSLLKDLSEKETGLQYFECLVKYIFSNVEDITPEEFQSIVSNTLSDDKGGLIMTLAEKLRNEGLQKSTESLERQDQIRQNSSRIDQIY